jgi:hypothetical protein
MGSRIKEFHPLQTYSVNALAESFEIDRGTMVKALRNVPPDVEKTKGRPLWKISTASNALEAHRRRMGTSKGGNNGGAPHPRLEAIFAEYDKAEAAMRALKTLGERRRAARAMVPMIQHMDRMTRKIGIANGHDDELVHLRADVIYRLCLRGFEAACGWSSDEVWKEFNPDDD